MVLEKHEKTYKTIKSIIKLIVFLLILLICINGMNTVLRRKDAYKKTEEFFSQKEDFDVLFFGNSHMYNGIFPMELWNKYGIVSYNMAQSATTIAISYYNVLFACNEHKPKLVVIDAYYVAKNDKFASENVTLPMHNTFDVYPLSYAKYEAIKDLFDGKNLLENEIEYLFNFSLYHSRWSELEKKDFELEKNYCKGASYLTKIVEPRKTNNFDDVETYSGKETNNMQYLRKIIEYCKNNNIEVLVTYLPYPALDNEMSYSKYVKNICDEYNVNYLNFLGLDLVNYNIDCYDTGSHLNVSGARKVTDYLGKYIKEKYNIPDQRKNGTYNFWKDDYEEFVDYKIKRFSECEKDIEKYLLLLYDEKDIKYEIKISSKKDIEGDNRIKQLLENIDNNYEINDDVFKESKDNKDKTVKITTWDNRTGKLIKEVWF